MKYYVASGRQPAGPFELATLREMNITPSTLVWHDKLPDWVRADQVDEIRVEVLGLAPLGAPHAPAAPAMPPQGAEPAKAPYQPHPYDTPAGAPYPQQPQDGYGQGNGWNPNGGMPPCPPTYLAFSIIVTVLCCRIFGVVAIVNSSKVSSLYNQGRYDESLRASNAARNWCIAALVGGVLAAVIWGLCMFVANDNIYSNLYDI